MHGAFAIMAAIYHRNETSEGQYIDAAMIEGSVNFLGEMVMDYTMNGNPGERLGNRDKIMAPHGCYRCQGTDEWVAIAVSNQKEWQSFCRVLGSPDWTRSEEFSDELSRWKNQDKLDRWIEEWTRHYHPYQIMEMLQKAGVMAGVSHNVRDLVDDPQLKQRKFFCDVDHPVLGNITLAGIPLRLSKNPSNKTTPPPLLGEHNDYVFGTLLGLSKEEITALEEEKVLY
jgi:benzylsuccinate CoA-transferase BbsF subunit